MYAVVPVFHGFSGGEIDIFLVSLSRRISIPMKSFHQYVNYREADTADLGLENRPDDRKLMSLVKIAVDKYPKRVMEMLEELKDHDHHIRAGLEELRAMPGKKIGNQSGMPNRASLPCVL